MTAAEPLPTPRARSRRGIYTGLEFMEESYGPFAQGVNRILNRLVNDGVVTMRPKGQMVRIEAGRTLDDARRRYPQYLTEHEDAIKGTIDLATDRSSIHSLVRCAGYSLVDGSETNRRESPPGNHTVEGARRCSPISQARFAEAIRDMRSLGWLDAHES